MNEFILPGNIVSAQWLHSHYSYPNLKILDSSWHMPSTSRNAKEEFGYDRLPRAIFFDFDKEICDRSNPLPHMLPSEESFGKMVGQLGISNDDVIVVYDTEGIFTSPRAWWMFKAMGHKQVAVLNGGLQEWKKLGFLTETGKPGPILPANYSATFQPEWIFGANQVLGILDNPEYQILDARSCGRFLGTTPEPREGLRPGHMPGAKNLPYSDLLENGKMRPLPELKHQISSLVSGAQHLVCSCGSGVTACIIALAAEESGHKKISVYDGSWSEWGLSEKGFPITTD